MMASAALKMDDVGIEHFADELKPGTKLLHGQFEILSFLNAGGFGITYVARDSLQRRVVIKECFPSAFCRRTDTKVAARSRQRQDEFRSIVAHFLEEALNLSRLTHPNIVKVHQVFQDNDTAYMAMDLVEGPDLLETVEGKAPKLTVDEIIRCLTKMLDAIGHVHAEGFLHRDISPDNILLDRATGEPVLIDFGAAKKEVTRKSRALSGLRVVKDGYSPQEFYISGSKQAPCSDLYALAASFSHLISGEAPRTSQERLSAIANREKDPQQPLAGRIKGYPQGFLAAIDKAMAIFPKDRLQSAAEWQAMLHATGIGAGRPVVTAAPGAGEPPVAASVDMSVEVAPVAAMPAAAPIAEPMAVPVMRPRGAMLRAVILPALAGALFVAGVMSLPEGMWQRIGLMQAEPATGVAATGAATALQAAPQMSGPYAQARVVRLPFLSDPADPALVAAVAPWSPDWITPGQRIVEINGTPVQAGASIAGMMAAGLDLASLAEVRVIFGYEDRPGGDIVSRAASLPVVDQLQLSNGYVFEMEPTENGLRTMVTGVPAVAAGDLQLGDVLLAYAATGEALGTENALLEILRREMSNNVATYGFAVQRSGGVAAGSFVLDGGE